MAIEAVTVWPNNRILDLFGIQLLIIQAPTAGSVWSEMVVAVSEAGGLGSLPCALLSLEQMRTELEGDTPPNQPPNQCEFLLSYAPRVTDEATSQRNTGEAEIVGRKPSLVHDRAMLPGAGQTFFSFGAITSRWCKLDAP
jgi:hypothetical protein